MHKERSGFSPPKNKDEWIWRYLDFTKFVSMLDNAAQYFARADTLLDPFEGTLPRAHSGSDKKSAMDWRQSTFINSWHVNDQESAAMWRLFVKGDEGIAIRSTYTKLVESLYQEQEDIFIGMINYIDYDAKNITIDKGLAPVMYKRKSFEYEQELRAVIFRDLTKEGIMRLIQHQGYRGLYIPSDLNTLIDKIFVAPTTQPWFAELIKSVLEKYNFRKDVVRSSLAKDPVY